MAISEESACNFSVPVSPLPSSSRLSAAACLSVFAVMALVGNCISLGVLWRVAKPANANTLFVGLLSVTNLSAVLFIMPLEIWSIIEDQWAFGDGVLCSAFAFFKFFNIGITMLIISLIAINRLMLVGYRRLYPRIYSMQLVCLQVAAVAIFLVVCLSPTLLSKWGRFGLDIKLQTCSVLPLDGQSPKQDMFLVGFLLPCLIICISYSAIVMILVLSRRRLTSYHSTSADSSDGPSWSDAECRVAVLGLLLFVIFSACHAPVAIIKMIDQCNDKPLLHLIGDITVYSSLWINPVVYIHMSSQYKDACRRLFVCACFSDQPEVRIDASQKRRTVA